MEMVAKNRKFALRNMYPNHSSMTYPDRPALFHGFYGNVSGCVLHNGMDATRPAEKRIQTSVLKT